MSVRRIPIIMFLLAALGLLLVAGCEEKPTEPSFNNPFDPDAPQASDIFNLIVTYRAGNINLAWTHVEGFNIANYNVQHSSTYSGDYLTVGTVPAPQTEVATYQYQNANPTATHYFRIQAMDENGHFTAGSVARRVGLTTPPLVTIGDANNAGTPTRYITLNMTVSEGDSLRVSQENRPESETVYAAAAAGEVLSVLWDLGEAAANDTLYLSVVSQTGNNLGEESEILVRSDFSPNLVLLGGGLKIASLTPTVAIDTTGMLNMRFADTEEGLADQDWLAPAPQAAPITFPDNAGPKTIFAEFEGNFGYPYIDDIELTADLLTDVEFTLDLPDDGITELNTVLGLCDAIATEMRFGESLDFGDAAWEAYSDTAVITLSEGAGEKIIYAQFRNEFAQSGILTDRAIYLNQPLAIAFNAPADGDTLTGGTLLQIQGRTSAPDEDTPVELVELNLGGDWLQLEGLMTWSYLWECPTVSEDSTVVLRSRATAGQETVTAQLSLTLIP